MTIVEIFLPILLVYLVIKVSQSVVDTSKTLVPEYKGPAEIIVQSYWAYEVILFTPNRAQYRRMMQLIQNDTST